MGAGFGLFAIFSVMSINVAIVGVLYVLEQGWGFRYGQSKRITYKHTDLIKPERESLLLADLRERTGLEVIRVLDFLSDSAELNIFYRVPVTR